MPAIANALSIVANSVVRLGCGIRVSWTDNSSDEDGFRIYYGTDGVTFPFTRTTGPNVTSVRLGHLIDGQLYYFYVVAFNAGGESAPSATQSAVAGTQPGGFITATGGTITTDGDFKVHSFTTNGTFEVTDGADDVEYLVVAGGGTGGAGYTTQVVGGGGGGAGGVKSGSKSVIVGTYSITVGGTEADSVLDDVTAHAGGRGGQRFSPATNGGSGGGGDSFSNPGGTGIAGEGHDGGSQGGFPGGSGGGATVAGSSHGGNDGPAGGAGVSSSITGSAVNYGGGGGGAGGGFTMAGLGGLVELAGEEQAAILDPTGWRNGKYWRWWRWGRGFK